MTSNDKRRNNKGNPKLYKGMEPLNPNGRPKGSMNKWTILSRELLTERGPEIVQVIIDRALKGDVHCLKMCIDRIVPQTKAVEINHRKHEGGVIINVGTTEQIIEQAKKTEPKQVRNKSEDAVLAEVADELP
jgi:hypothetical protein|tara:strand:- start:446 stop:841 length:396 start_codon:yes stop_codon:yes gene_type:complete